MVCYIEGLYKVKKTAVEWQLDLKHRFICDLIKGNFSRILETKALLGYVERRMWSKEIILVNNFNEDFNKAE